MVKFHIGDNVDRSSVNFEEIHQFMKPLREYIYYVLNANDLEDTLAQYDAYYSAFYKRMKEYDEDEFPDYEYFLTSYKNNLQKIKQLEPLVKSAFDGIAKDTLTDKLVSLLLVIPNYAALFCEVNRIVPIPQIMDYMNSNEEYEVLRKRHGPFIHLLTKLFVKLQARSRKLKPASAFNTGKTTFRRGTKKPNKPIVVKQSVGKKTNRIATKPSQLSFMTRIESVSGIRLKK